jgi:hypothetical protein
MGFIAYIIAFLFFTYIWWRILGKMGYWGLMRWPIHQDLELLRKHARK